jgi:hypothetical protein
MFLETVGMERGPLSLVSITELLEWKSSGSGSTNLRVTAVGIRRADHTTSVYPQKLALTSPTCGGRSVGVVLLRTKATKFSFWVYHWIIPDSRLRLKSFSRSTTTFDQEMQSVCQRGFSLYSDAGLMMNTDLLKTHLETVYLYFDMGYSLKLYFPRMKIKFPLYCIFLITSMINSNFAVWLRQNHWIND